MVGKMEVCKMEKKQLPVAVRKAGGAVADVLGWPQHVALDRNSQYAIAKFFSDKEERNDLYTVDLVADMASYHGEPIDQELLGLFEEFGPDVVYIATELLLNMGYRTSEEHDRAELIKVCTVISKLSEAGLVNITDSEGIELATHRYETTDMEQLAELIRSLGGFSVLADTDLEEIE